jgi:hypothetical protein
LWVLATIGDVLRWLDDERDGRGARAGRRASAARVGG